jgi:hypothetical protein
MLPALSAMMTGGEGIGQNRKLLVDGAIVP